MAGRRGQDGFTLLELVVVLAIVSIGFALAAPRIGGGFGSVKAKTAAKKVAAAMKYARLTAVRERSVCRAAVETGRVLLSCSRGGQASMVKEVTLPDEVSIGRSGGPAVDFFPGGASSGGVFEIRTADGAGAAYAVKVEPFTGEVRVKTL